MRTFDGIFLEFPLCCLSYPQNQLESIIALCIIKEAGKIKYLHKEEEDKIEADYFPEDFNDKDKWCLLITIASYKLRIKIKSYVRIKELASGLHMYINDFINKYGNDAYCRIGKCLLIDTINKRFDNKSFGVLCSISSVIGNSRGYKQIAKKTIAIRMLGYKSKKIFSIEKRNDQKLLSVRQIQRIINNLHGKGFFGKFTYAKRISYYSTRMDDEQLRKKVLNDRIRNKKSKLINQDEEYTLLIKNQIELLEKRHLLKMSTGGKHIGSLN